MTETITLTISMVVNGKKKLNPGRLITMSPGRRNSGQRLNTGHRRPATVSTTPSMMSGRFIGPGA